MTVQEAIVDFCHKWIDTGRADLPAFVEAAHVYFTDTVIDGTPEATKGQNAPSHQPAAQQAKQEQHSGQGVPKK